GFKKSLVLARGGGPVWYVDKGSPMAAAVLRLIARARASDSAADDPVWAMTPFIDHTGTYDHGDYRFEWEREWRHVGPFPFTTQNVAFLVPPEEHHDGAREFFDQAEMENPGPAYYCPYIDPRWDRNRVRKALAVRLKR